MSRAKAYAASQDRRRSARRDLPSTARRSRIYALVALAAAGLVQLPIVPGPVADLVGVLIGLSVVGVVAVAARKQRPHKRLAWHLIAAGQLLWVVAALRPAPGNVLHLLGSVVLVVGLVVLGKGRFHGVRDLGPLVDSACATTGLGLVLSTVLAGPALTALHHSTGATLLAVAGPALDVAMIAALLLQVGSPGGRSVAFRYLALALGVLLYGDTLATALDLGTPGSGGSLGYFWLVGAVLVGTAALHPSLPQLAVPSVDPEIRFRGMRLLAVVASIMIGPAILSVHQARAAGPDEGTWMIVLGSVAMALLVVLRMDLTIEQMGTAHRSLEALQEELAVQAARDPLTDLANRTQSMRQVAGALGRSRRHGGTVGVLFVDLDGFKLVNDEHGHRSGDEVLREVARRMSGEVREGDFIGRLGGDEFLVGTEDVPDEAAAVALAHRLIAAVSQDITIADGTVVRVGASVGVSLGRGGETDVESLLHEADMAVYQAKAAGRGRAQLFSGQVREALRKQTETEHALVQAIARDELVLHYQPIVHVETGALECYEALVRWNRPGVGLVFPDEFLPVAEASDLICDLDAWVLRAAAEDLANWNRERGDQALQVAVNISGRHISKPRILDDVTAALRIVDILPPQLVIEVTETALMDAPIATVNLDALRHLGLVVSLDDFGTGYHSTAQLSKLPVDVLKIDRQYVAAETDSERSLLELMVMAAHAHGARVVAEGIERADQLEMVRELGCEYAQGYFIGVPLPAEDLDPGLAQLRAG